MTYEIFIALFAISFVAGFGCGNAWRKIHANHLHRAQEARHATERKLIRNIGVQDGIRTERQAQLARESKLKAVA